MVTSLKCLLNCTPSVEFSISTNAPLEVDPISGVVYAPEGAFDFEANPEHTVRIVATDSRDDPELSQVSSPFLVTITVEDVNDESPRLTSPNGTQVCNSIYFVSSQNLSVNLFQILFGSLRHVSIWSALVQKLSHNLSQF